MLQVKDLKKEFKVPVITRLNLNLDMGQTLILMGENGAGKTTLLKILASIIAPDEGSITLDNVDILKNPNHLKMLSSFVFTDKRSFYMRLTGMNNLAFFSAFYNLSPCDLNLELKKILTQLDINTDFLYRPVQEYSSGQVQILAIIRALLNNPQYLFIDELSSSLDSLNRQKIISLLKNRADDSNALLLVSHSIEEAQNFAGDIIELKNGEISSV